MRLFAAIVPPPAVLEHLEAAVAPVRDDELKWTYANAWHLTLAFYGELADDRVPELVERLQRAAGRHRALELGFAGAGRFGSRVLWVGCAGELDVLRSLARSCAAAGRRVGAAVDEKRPFRAHVTLARARRPVNLRPYVDTLAGYAGPTWTARQVVLVRSDLGAGEGGRPRYETQSAFDLPD
ncbi:MAG: RNA 2',3'-cyclic phosphodiesterase [Actinomycetota bacterium]